MVREHVYGRGIRDPRVIEAMLRVPRHLFIGRDAGIEAYADHSYPIGFRQTMSQPYMVAYLCEQLRLDGEERVLKSDGSIPRRRAGGCAARSTASNGSRTWRNARWGVARPSVRT
jgi:hypothetical protein